ncbi:hypothetical protein COK91_26780 [Bacillus cereus]|nr:hypothetical protein COK91_26780 [Bacillus cereus]
MCRFSIRFVHFKKIYLFYVKGAKKYFVVLFFGMGIYLGHLDADLTIVYVRYMKWFVIYV